MADDVLTLNRDEKESEDLQRLKAASNQLSCIGLESEDLARLSPEERDTFDDLAHNMRDTLDSLLWTLDELNQEDEE